MAGLTLPFEASQDSTGDLFRVINTDGGGGGVTGGSYGTDQFGDTGTGVTGQSDVGQGVSGSSQSSQGVYGQSQSSQGVSGVSDSDAGVSGWSNTGQGVVGHSQTGNGGLFSSSGAGNGVQGTTGDGNSSGVIGTNTDGGNGVYGTSVSGNAVAGHSQKGNAGYFGSSGAGAGVYAESQSGPAGYFAGDILVTGDLVLINSPASGDIAEDFDLDDEPLNAEPGTVLVIGGGGKLSACAEPYDTRVAGVVSGAGELRPAVVLQRLNDGRCRSPIALIGKVVCKVDAEFGSIEAGDLLTTSPTPGCAMKVTDRSKALGAVLGKALRRHDAGYGMIPILVSMR